ncbi:MAG TPA: S8 family serine peptidase [Candidatus Acidoferrales bacterium]|nr:S8 family serine peptidase [Candidatus Acidoferrales bacterium]
MKRKSVLCLVGALLCFLVPPTLSAANDAGLPPDREQALAKIYEEAKDEFFATINKLIATHPQRSELTGDDALRIRDARTDIPNLFERVMIVAYQKDAPTFSQWIEKGDQESLAQFREKFVELAKDYAARFVGSLFRRLRIYEFTSALPHNRGKGRLDLVLQSLGYNVKNDSPEVPPEQRFSNVIEPDYTSQWTLAAVNAPKAQEITKGAGVVVAVLDSGLDPYNSLFKDKTVPGFSFLQRTKPPWEEEATTTVDWGVHGTVVASTVLLIAPDCLIMPVRVTDGETMNDPVYPNWLFEVMAAGMYYAVNHGADIIQFSAPLSASEPVIAQAVRYAYSKNVVVSTSAGNISRPQWGVPPEEQMYYSFRTEVLLVGGLEKEGSAIRSWPHTVPHPVMTVAAPSKDVFVVVPTYIKEMKNDYVAGTSLSSPIVSGVVALMKSAAPPPPEMMARPGEYVRLVSKCLRETARLDLLGLAEPNDVVGHGVVDAYAAVQKIQQSLSQEK